MAALVMLMSCKALLSYMPYVETSRSGSCQTFRRSMSHALASMENNPFAVMSEGSFPRLFRRLATRGFTSSLHRRSSVGPNWRYTVRGPGPKCWRLPPTCFLWRVVSTCTKFGRQNRMGKANRQLSVAQRRPLRHKHALAHQERHPGEHKFAVNVGHSQSWRRCNSD